MDREYYLLYNADDAAMYYCLTNKGTRCYIYFKKSKLTKRVDGGISRKKYKNYNDYLIDLQYLLLGTEKINLNQIK